MVTGKLKGKTCFGLKGDEAEEDWLRRQSNSPSDEWCEEHRHGHNRIQNPLIGPVARLTDNKWTLCHRVAHTERKTGTWLSSKQWRVGGENSGSRLVIKGSDKTAWKNFARVWLLLSNIESSLWKPEQSSCSTGSEGESGRERSFWI